MRREITGIIDTGVGEPGLVMTPPVDVEAGTYSQEFAGTSNFTVPAGVTEIVVETWGGGGAGGGGTSGATDPRRAG